MSELVARARRADAASSLLAAGGFAALAVVVIGAGPSTVLKSFTFLLSFGIVFYLVVSVVRRGSAVNTLAKTFVAGGAVVGLLAVLEARTGITPFTRLHELVP